MNTYAHILESIIKPRVNYIAKSVVWRLCLFLCNVYSAYSVPRLLIDMATKGTVASVSKNRKVNYYQSPEDNYKGCITCIIHLTRRSPGGSSSIFKSLIPEHVLRIMFMTTSCELLLSRCQRRPLVPSQHWFRLWLGAVRQ